MQTAARFFEHAPHVFHGNPHFIEYVAVYDLAGCDIDRPLTRDEDQVAVGDCLRIGTLGLRAVLRDHRSFVHAFLLLQFPGSVEHVHAVCHSVYHNGDAMRIAVHVTHEAVQKIGGIGSVIAGLCTEETYKSFFDTTVLYGPLFSPSADVRSRLGRGAEVLYSSTDSYDQNEFHGRFLPLIEEHHINIVYGKRTLASEFNSTRQNTIDVVLVDITKMKAESIGVFKYSLWEQFALQSEQFPDWDYEQYVRIAVPYLDILACLYHQSATIYHFAHEYMGVPSVLAAHLNSVDKSQHRTIFYAHEISPCRAVVENTPGHDVSFYNTLADNQAAGKSFEQEYSGRTGGYRAELVKRTRHFDHVFAVSDIVKREYQYFVPEADESKVHVVYNGVPLKYVSIQEKLQSRALLQEYGRNLFDFVPDYIFTHVTRLVVSKGIWRDITFLYILDEIFHKQGLKGLYILLSTLVGAGRDALLTARMEQEYGWPVVHAEGWPDLIGSEVDIYNYLARFNSNSRCIKGVFLNQFGFSRRRCGNRVPETTDFLDLRIGSDAEFGFSIYEPFGIAQLETIPFGGIAALSDACGCSHAVGTAFADSQRKPYHVFEFVRGLPEALSEVNLRSISIEQRFELEKQLLRREVGPFTQALPTGDSDRSQLLEAAQECSELLGWKSSVTAMNLSTL